MPDDVASDVAAAQDEEMGRCILGLYRSSPVEDMRSLSRQLEDMNQPRGLVIIPTEDEYAGTPAMAQEVANSLGADTIMLAGLGHWWMFAGAEQAADALIKHWSPGDL